MAEPAHTGGDPEPDRPIPETYWVAPGRLLVGEYPGSASRATAMDRLRRFLQAGVTCFLDLTEIAELPCYEPCVVVFDHARVRVRTLPKLACLAPRECDVRLLGP